MIWRVVSCGFGGEVDAAESHTFEPQRCGRVADAESAAVAVLTASTSTSPIPLPQFSRGASISSINQLGQVNRRLSAVDRDAAFASSFVDSSPQTSAHRDARADVEVEKCEATSPLGVRLS